MVPSPAGHMFCFMSWLPDLPGLCNHEQKGYPLFFQDRISCFSVWPLIHWVAKADLELRIPCLHRLVLGFVAIGHFAWAFPFFHPSVLPFLFPSPLPFSLPLIFLLFSALLETKSRAMYTLPSALPRSGTYPLQDKQVQQTWSREEVRSVCFQSQHNEEESGEYGQQGTSGSSITPPSVFQKQGTLR